MVRLIRDGEMLVVPNSKLVHEVVTTYEEWEERRSQLNFTIDSKATVQQVKSIKVKFKNLIEEAEGIRGERVRGAKRLRWLQYLTRSLRSLHMIFLATLGRRFDSNDLPRRNAKWVAVRVRLVCFGLQRQHRNFQGCYGQSR